MLAQLEFSLIFSHVILGLKLKLEKVIKVSSSFSTFHFRPNKCSFKNFLSPKNRKIFDLELLKRVKKSLRIYFLAHTEKLSNGRLFYTERYLDSLYYVCVLCTKYSRINCTEHTKKENLARKRSSLNQRRGRRSVLVSYSIPKIVVCSKLSKEFFSRCSSYLVSLLLSFLHFL